MINREKLEEFLKGIAISVVIIVIFTIIFWIMTNYPHLKYHFKLSRQTFPYGIFSSNFGHNYQEHLVNNSIVMLIFGPIFFYYLGGKQGIFYFILIGIGAHLLGFITMEIVRIYLEQKNSNLTIFSSSTGSSGVLSGIMFFVSFELFKSLYKSVKENRKMTEGEREDFLTMKNIILKVIPPFFPAYLLIERIAADLKALFLELALQTSESEPDFLTTLFSDVSKFIPLGSDTGNAYLGHFWGVVVVIIFIKQGWIKTQFQKQNENHQNSSNSAKSS